MKLYSLLLLPIPLFCQQTDIPQDKDKASLEGQVFNAVTGEPLRKVRLTMRINVAQPQQDARRPPNQAPQSTPSPQTVVSDAVGKFAFVNLEPGNYQLIARRDGFQDKEYGAKTTGKAADIILLGAGSRKSKFEVRMTPFGVIAGRLVDQDGDPIQNVRVAAMRFRYTNTGRELEESQTAATDDLGQYRLFNVAPGKYYIKATPPQMNIGRKSDETESFAPAFYPGVADVINATLFDLSAGQQLGGLNLQMRGVHYATLRGRIIAPPGASMSVGLMVISGSGSSSHSTGINDKEGKFELYGVGPGDIYVTGEYTSNGQTSAAQLPLHVGSSDINGIELRPSAAVDVTGQVRIEGTTTVTPSKVRVMLQGPGRHGRDDEAGIVKDNGALLLRGVQSTVYRVNISGLNDLYLKSVHWGTADITDATLDLTGGVPPGAELVVAIGADSAQIEGTIKNENGDPVDSATVTLVPTGTHSYSFYFKSAASNAGKFIIHGVAPGSYRILAWDKVEPNAVKFDPDYLRPYEGAGQNLQVQSGDTQNLELKLTINKQP